MRLKFHGSVRLKFQSWIRSERHLLIKLLKSDVRYNFILVLVTAFAETQFPVIDKLEKSHVHQERGATKPSDLADVLFQI